MVRREGTLIAEDAVLKSLRHNVARRWIKSVEIQVHGEAGGMKGGGGADAGRARRRKQKLSFSSASDGGVSVNDNSAKHE